MKAPAQVSDVPSASELTEEEKIALDKVFYGYTYWFQTGLCPYQIIETMRYTLGASINEIASERLIVKIEQLKK